MVLVHKREHAVVHNAYACWELIQDFWVGGGCQTEVVFTSLLAALLASGMGKKLQQAAQVVNTKTETHCIELDCRDIKSRNSLAVQYS